MLALKSEWLFADEFTRESKLNGKSKTGSVRLRNSELRCGLAELLRVEAATFCCVFAKYRTLKSSVKFMTLELFQSA